MAERRWLGPFFAAAAAGAVALTLGYSVRGETVKKRWNEEFDLGEGGSLVVRNDVGTIRVSPSPDRLVHVEVAAGVGGRQAAQAAAELGLRIDRTERSVRIQRDKGWRDFGLWDRLFARRAAIELDYQIRVPAGLVLDLHTANGDVIVEGVEGRMELGTANGNIVTQGAAGVVSGTTVNGRIDVELRRADAGARMSFETINGGIRTRLPRDLCAALDARSQNGSVRVDFPVRMTGAVYRNGVVGVINDCSGGSLRYRSINGDVRVLAG